MPGLRLADHFAVGKFAHFLADRFQRLIEAAHPDRGIVAGAYQRDQAGAPFRGVATGDQAFDVSVDAGGNLRRRQAQVERPHDLALAHRDAANDLGEIFAEPDAHEVFLKFAEGAVADHAFRVGGELAHGLHIGGEPGQPVSGALLAIEQAANRMAFHHHPLAHLDDGVGQQGIERGGRLAAEFDQFVFGGGTGGGDRHGVLGYRR